MEEPVTHLRPGQRDLTSGPIGSALLMFALPTLASNVLQSLNGSINAIWVGRFLGEGALAATSNANIIMFLMFGAVFGFGMAATIIVGQSWGRRDVDAARRAFGSAIGLVLAGSVIVGALGWIFAPEILTTSRHLAVSSAMNRARSAGVPPTGSAPSARNRSTTSGFLRMRSTSDDTRATIASGVPRGATITNHDSAA